MNKPSIVIMFLAPVLAIGACSGSTSAPTMGTGGALPGAGGDRQGGTTTGGVSGTGGSVMTGGARTGDMTATGGTVSAGGIVASGGTQTGGVTTTGGKVSTGGVTATGGKVSTGGTVASGGIANTGGSIEPGTGDASAAGGVSASGGRTGSGGTSVTGGISGGTGGQTGTGGSTSGGTGPCDIYAAGNAPCTAAFSSVRALYGAYAGNLYQVKKSDGTTKDIGVVSPGGSADTAAQDTFCAGTGSCTISTIYDQSGQGNHLKSAPKGGKYGPYDCIEAVADTLPIKIGGKKAYGIHVAPSGTNYMNPYQTAYRNNQTTGTATGDMPESIYMVADGTYYNDQCCFDFGNAETQGLQAGPKGSMHAIYLGNCTFWNKGAGNGPWIMADLESGLFNTSGTVGATNSKGLSMPYAFVTAMTKNNSAGKSPGSFALRAGNAQSGTLTTFWDGARPTGYEIMQKQGAIVLGIGGDTGSGARGNFFEGAMTNGYASAETENAVHANIVAAGYSK